MVRHFVRVGMCLVFVVVGLGLPSCSDEPSSTPSEFEGGAPATEENGITTGTGGNSDSGICKKDSDCGAILTRPSDCAIAHCDSGTCIYESKDADRDGYKDKRCISLEDGVLVAAGSDCDDSDGKVNPTAWDGPKGDGQANGCNDGLDNDCTGTVDDGQLKNGTTCQCTPGEISECAQTPSGQAIDFPVLDSEGLPLGRCEVGSRTCFPNGTWGECTGAVGPSTETCDGQDNDCDGLDSLVDSDTQKPFYACDEDSDNYLAKNPKIIASCFPPESGCVGQWLIQTGAAQGFDCDDSDLYVFPGASERCNRKDDNCSTGGGVEPLEDQDDDGHTSVGYTACEGGFPKDDCVDSNSDVFAGQTKWFGDFYCAEGYQKCSDSSAPAMTWCSGVKGSCSPKPTSPYVAPQPTPQIWDYNCSGASEARDRTSFQSACSAAFNSDCDVEAVPAAGACGSTQALYVCVKTKSFCTYMNNDASTGEVLCR